SLLPRTRCAQSRRSVDPPPKSSASSVHTWSAPPCSSRRAAPRNPVAPSTEPATLDPHPIGLLPPASRNREPVCRRAAQRRHRRRPLKVALHVPVRTQFGKLFRH